MSSLHLIRTAPCRPASATALVALMALLSLNSPAAQNPATPTNPASPTLQTVRPLSDPAAELRRWVTRTGNNAGAPYVVVDKRQARVWVFDAQHRPLADSAALLGLAFGDREVADITRRDVTRLSRDARITPAGRFVTEPGLNLQGEDVVWLDYAAGLALHRLRPGLSQAARLQRLSSTAVGAQRVSMGCVVVPVAFYEGVIRPLLGRQAGVVYVLPEHSPLQAWLPRWEQPTRTAGGPARPGPDLRPVGPG